jgi:hypothetical protein
VGYYTVIVKGALVPLLMAFFGLWTVKNIQSVHRVTTVPALSNTGMTLGAGSSAVHAKNRQLIRILLMDISNYIIFSSASSVFVMYQQVTQYNTKSLIVL